MDEVWAINQFAIHDRMPQLTFYLDIEPEAGLARIAASRDREVNRLDLEDLSFHHKVREGYLQLADRFQDRIVVIDASQTVENVEQEIIRSLEERILKDF